MADEQSGGVAVADHRLERLQHLDLGGHVERAGRLVADHQLRPLDQPHRHHEALQLAAGDLVREALADTPGIGQIEPAVQVVRARQRLGERAQAVDARRLGHLEVEAQRRVERGGGALRDIGHAAAAQVAQQRLAGAQQVGRAGPDAAAAHGEARPDKAECREGQRRLARAGFADERQHLALRHGKRDAVDDRRAAGLRRDDQPVDCEHWRGHRHQPRRKVRCITHRAPAPVGGGRRSHRPAG